MNQRLVFAFLLLLLPGACMKHAPEQPAEEPIPQATIQFIAPAAGSIFHNKDSIHVKATAISTEAIHGFDVSIRNAADKTVYYFNHIHDHNDTLLVDVTWENYLTTPTDLEAEITLYLDHAGHLYKSTTAFKSR